MDLVEIWKFPIESPIVRMCVDKSKSLAVFTWYKSPTLEEIKEAGIKALIIVVEHHIKYILNDNSEVENFWSSIDEWERTFWFPELCNLGVKRFARIRAQRVFAEVSARLVLHGAPSGCIECMLFAINEKEKALDFLIHGIATEA